MEKTLSENKTPNTHGTKVKPSELFAKILFIVCACISIVAVFGIIGYILYGSIPAFREIGFFNFLFGTVWQPTYDQFGILPMLVNSLIVTLGAIIIGGTVGVFTAIFLAFWCPDKFHLKYKGKNKFLKKCVDLINKINLRTIFDQIIKVLAGIPSIVYGLFGLEILVSAFSGGSPIGGKGIMTCSIMLAIMILPTVTSLSKNALDAVPAQYYEGALALGNTKAQAVFRVVVPAARSGIISALILGVGRAVGEAMAVIWVSGNRALFPTGLFSFIRTLTTNIVMEMGYATNIHRSALIATGLVLLVLVLIITLSMNLVPKEFKGKRGNKVLHGDASAKPVFRKKGALPMVGAIFGMVCAGIVGAMLLLIILYILISGVGCLTADFLFGEASINEPTLGPALLATLELIGITLVIALPVGICAAIYLNEYAKKGSKIVKVIRTFIDTLSGVPSIVFGLFGYLLFVRIFGRSVFAGAFTMVLVVLPTIIRSTEEALFAVPMPLREASYGLGASKVRTIFKIVLPSAFPGIATASILAIGRIIGESAALIFTMGTAFNFSGNPGSAGSSLAVLLYSCANEGFHMDQAYALAVILLALTLVLNLIVYFIQRSVKKKR